MTRPITRLLASALAVPVLLAGCGGDPKQADNGNDSTTQPTTDSNGNKKDTTKKEEKSPLSEYVPEYVSVSSGSGGSFTVSRGGEKAPEPTAEDLAKQAKVQDAIAKCMRAEGFEYVPAPPRGREKTKFDEAFELPPDKFAEQYGYGISTIDFAEEQPEDKKDANQKIREKLSEKARKAYDKALHGAAQVMEVGGKVGWVTKEDGKNQGCFGKAYEQVFGKMEAPGEMAKKMRKFDGLYKDLEALRKRIESDPRVSSAVKAWSDCMADAGHTGLKKPADANTKVTTRWDSLSGARQPSPAPGGGITTKLPDRKIDPAKLAAMKKFEIEIATADYKCQQEHYQKPYKEAQFELEREFIANHKAILEQYKAMMAENGAR